MAAPSKQTTARTRPAAPATRSAMSERLMALHAETNDPQPYEVTNTIVVYPPNRTRRKQMYNAELKLSLCNGLLAQAMSRVSTPAPEKPADDAPAETVLAYAKARGEWEVLVAGADEAVESINAQIAEATVDYERGFFGEAHDAIMEFFEDKPLLWDKFVEDIKSEFLPAAPSDGKCRTCGQIVDEDAAGKVPTSST
ncbi:hypothetical protein [Arthrobacter sp. SLBN-53]|uniref:hypothetical protein n=1 Tax=Arthrobacter sp. SLBN-53 TaxID=2768412 RepID=UPI00114E9915|nr:hypothetical protein [Arthrobacter sp. SLBN-53]TQK29377.1 hypothetical protein FBY28_2380 [Arthrobacter sp. SLBN-53]